MRPTSSWIAAAALLTTACAVSQSNLQIPVTGSSTAPPRPIAAGFETNRGQTDGSVRYLLRSHGYHVFFTDAAAHVSVPLPADGASQDPDPRYFSLPIRFVGASTREVEAVGPAIGTTGYYRGEQGDWIESVSMYEEIRYRDVYPGIDLLFTHSNGGFGYAFEVEPGADVSEIWIRLDGARPMVARDGALVARAGSVSMRHSAPRAFEAGEDEGDTEVPVRYRVDGDAYGFTVPRRDPDRALRIHPDVTIAILVGGEANDEARAVAVGADGGVYAVGRTTSPLFPGTNIGEYVGGPYQAGDAFVTRLDIGGDGSPTPTWTRFLGGAGDDEAKAVVVGPDGLVYVGGTIVGYDPNEPFPTLDALVSDGGPGFVSALGPDGSLQASTYLGGGVNSLAAAAPDDAAAVVAAGTVSGPEFDPAVTPAYPYAGGTDGFVLGLTAGLATTAGFTFLGGENTDAARAVGVRDGTIAVAGTTGSTDFPVLQPLQECLNRNPDCLNLTTTPRSDAFVAALDLATMERTYATYLGGNSNDRAGGVAMDDQGAILVAGTTHYDENFGSPVAFPTSGDAYLPGPGTGGFVARLVPGEDDAYRATLLGETSEYLPKLAIAPEGTVWIAGSTDAGTDFLPDPPAPAGFPGGGMDAFLVGMAPDLASLVEWYRVGGSEWEQGDGVTVGNGALWLVGRTGSDSWTGGDGQVSGLSDAFVLAIGAPTVSTEADLMVSVHRQNEEAIAGSTTTWTAYLQNLGPATAEGVQLEAVVEMPTLSSVGYVEDPTLDCSMSLSELSSVRRIMTVVCEANSLAPGETASLELETTPPSGSSGETLSCSAEATSDQDPTPWNDADEDVVELTGS